MTKSKLTKIKCPQCGTELDASSLKDYIISKLKIAFEKELEKLE